MPGQRREEAAISSPPIAPPSGDLLDAGRRDGLLALRGTAAPAVQRLLEGADALRDTARAASQAGGFLAPIGAIERFLADGGVSGPDDLASARRALLADRALAWAELAPRLRLPPAVTALVPREIDRLLARPLDASPAGDPAADREGWGRDIALVLGLSAPVGVVVVDLIPRTVGPRAFARSIVRDRSFGPASRYLRDRTWGPWFISHLDLRYKDDELNPDGWRAHYRRTAALLRLHPEIRGLFAMSWLFDPGVVAVSPKLGFFHAIPTSGGAYVVYNGVLPDDVVRATATSRRRTELVLEGTWVPRTHTVLWPSAALIAWADRQTGPLLP